MFRGSSKNTSGGYFDLNCRGYFEFENELYISLHPCPYTFKKYFSKYLKCFLTTPF